MLSINVQFFIFIVSALFSLSCATKIYVKQQGTAYYTVILFFTFGIKQKIMFRICLNLNDQALSMGLPGYPDRFFSKRSTIPRDNKSCFYPSSFTILLPPSPAGRGVSEWLHRAQLLTRVKPQQIPIFSALGKKCYKNQTYITILAVYPQLIYIIAIFKSFFHQSTYHK